jgi:hypothetical protein
MMGDSSAPDAAETLTGVLVQIVLHPRANWRTVAAAGELIACAARFDEWFVRVAKPSAAPDTAVESVLATSEDAEMAVGLAWNEAVTSGDFSTLEAVLTDAAATITSCRNLIEPTQDERP